MPSSSSPSASFATVADGMGRLREVTDQLEGTTTWGPAYAAAAPYYASSGVASSAPTAAAASSAATDNTNNNNTTAAKAAAAAAAERNGQLMATTLQWEVAGRFLSSCAMTTLPPVPALATAGAGAADASPASPSVQQVALEGDHVLPLLHTLRTTPNALQRGSQQTNKTSLHNNLQNNKGISAANNTTNNTNISNSNIIYPKPSAALLGALPHALSFEALAQSVVRPMALHHVSSKAAIAHVKHKQHTALQQWRATREAAEARRKAALTANITHSGQTTFTDMTRRAKPEALLLAVSGPSAAAGGGGAGALSDGAEDDDSDYTLGGASEEGGDDDSGGGGGDSGAGAAALRRGSITKVTAADGTVMGLLMAPPSTNKQHDYVVETQAKMQLQTERVRALLPPKLTELSAMIRNGAGATSVSALLQKAANGSGGGGGSSPFAPSTATSSSAVHATSTAGGAPSPAAFKPSAVSAAAQNAAHSFTDFTAMTLSQQQKAIANDNMRNLVVSDENKDIIAALTRPEPVLTLTPAAIRALYAKPPVTFVAAGVYAALTATGPLAVPTAAMSPASTSTGVGGGYRSGGHGDGSNHGEHINSTTNPSNGIAGADGLVDDTALAPMIGNGQLPPLSSSGAVLAAAPPPLCSSAQQAPLPIPSDDPLLLAQLEDLATTIAALLLEGSQVMVGIYDKSGAVATRLASGSSSSLSSSSPSYSFFAATVAALRGAINEKIAAMRPAVLEATGAGGGTTTAVPLVSPRRDRSLSSGADTAASSQQDGGSRPHSPRALLSGGGGSALGTGRWRAAVAVSMEHLSSPLVLGEEWGASSSPAAAALHGGVGIGGTGVSRTTSTISVSTPMASARFNNNGNSSSGIDAASMVEQLLTTSLNAGGGGGSPATTKWNGGGCGVSSGSTAALPPALKPNANHTCNNNRESLIEFLSLVCTDRVAASIGDGQVTEVPTADNTNPNVSTLAGAANDASVAGNAGGSISGASTTTAAAFPTPRSGTGGSGSFLNHHNSTTASVVFCDLDRLVYEASYDRLHSNGNGNGNGKKTNVSSPATPRGIVLAQQRNLPRAVVSSTPLAQLLALSDAVVVCGAPTALPASFADGGWGKLQNSSTNNRSTKKKGNHPIPLNGSSSSPLNASQLLIPHLVAALCRSTHSKALARLHHRNRSSGASASTNIAVPFINNNGRGGSSHHMSATSASAATSRRSGAAAAAMFVAEREAALSLASRSIGLGSLGPLAAVGGGVGASASSLTSSSSSSQANGTAATVFGGYFGLSNISAASREQEQLVKCLLMAHQPHVYPSASSATSSSSASSSATSIHGVSGPSSSSEASSSSHATTCLLILGDADGDLSLHASSLGANARSSSSASYFPCLLEVLVAEVEERAKAILSSVARHTPCDRNTNDAEGGHKEEAEEQQSSSPVAVTATQQQHDALSRYLLSLFLRSSFTHVFVAGKGAPLLKTLHENRVIREEFSTTTDVAPAAAPLEAEGEDDYYSYDDDNDIDGSDLIPQQHHQQQKTMVMEKKSAAVPQLPVPSNIPTSLLRSCNLLLDVMGTVNVRGIDEPDSEETEEDMNANINVGNTTANSNTSSASASAAAAAAALASFNLMEAFLGPLGVTALSDTFRGVRAEGPTGGSGGDGGGASENGDDGTASYAGTAVTSVHHDRHGHGGNTNQTSAEAIRRSLEPYPFDELKRRPNFGVEGGSGGVDAAQQNHQVISYGVEPIGRIITAAHHDGGTSTAVAAASAEQQQSHHNQHHNHPHAPATDTAAAAMRTEQWLCDWLATGTVEQRPSSASSSSSSPLLMPRRRPLVLLLPSDVIVTKMTQSGKSKSEVRPLMGPRGGGNGGNANRSATAIMGGRPPKSSGTASPQQGSADVGNASNTNDAAANGSVVPSRPSSAPFTSNAAAAVGERGGAAADADAYGDAGVQFVTRDSPAFAIYWFPDVEGEEGEGEGADGSVNDTNSSNINAGHRLGDASSPHRLMTFARYRYADIGPETVAGLLRRTTTAAAAPAPRSSTHDDVAGTNAAASGGARRASISGGGVAHRRASSPTAAGPSFAYKSHVAVLALGNMTHTLLHELTYDAVFPAMPPLPPSHRGGGDQSEGAVLADNNKATTATAAPTSFADVITKLYASSSSSSSSSSSLAMGPSQVATLAEVMRLYGVPLAQVVGADTTASSSSSPSSQQAASSTSVSGDGPRAIPIPFPLATLPSVDVIYGAFLGRWHTAMLEVPTRVLTASSGGCGGAEGAAATTTTAVPPPSAGHNNTNNTNSAAATAATTTTTTNGILVDEALIAHMKALMVLRRNATHYCLDAWEATSSLASSSLASAAGTNGAAGAPSSSNTNINGGGVVVASFGGQWALTERRMLQQKAALASRGGGSSPSSLSSASSSVVVGLESSNEWASRIVSAVLMTASPPHQGVSAGSKNTATATATGKLSGDELFSLPPMAARQAAMAFLTAATASYGK